MTKKISLFVLLYVALNSFCAKAGDLGVDVGVGTYSNYGIVGVGVRYLFTEHFDLHVNTGKDHVGSILGGGARLYTGPMGDKCLFIIPCVPKLFIGAFGAKTYGGRIKVKEGSTESVYSFSEGSFASLAVGSYDKYLGFLTSSLEIGYRFVTHKPKYTHLSGPITEEDTNYLKKACNDSMFVSIGLGVQF